MLTTTPIDVAPIVDRLHADAAAERRTLVAQLTATPAAIAPKHFYDPVGCALYAAICELPEYYPTRTERAIFDAHRNAIAAAAGRGRQLVDLGAGDGRKAEALFAALAPVGYVAVDIAADALAATVARIAGAHPALAVRGVHADFAAGLDLAADLGPAPALFFYPGSSIGNFTPVEARAFLAAVRRHCRVPGSGLVIGVDTKKDPGRLVAAYDDAVGVTAAFNRNVLRNVNRILGSDFRPRRFRHVARYDEACGRIEMHLEAREREGVHLAPDAPPRLFEPGERIHTENSYKYAPDEFAALLAGAGFATIRVWQDPRRDFAVFHAQ
jgi:dimethylhistidine N-methyltransferase